MATTSRSESLRPSRQRRKLRPMRPKPLMATLSFFCATTASVLRETASCFFGWGGGIFFPGGGRRERESEFFCWFVSVGYFAGAEDGGGEAKGVGVARGVVITRGRSRGREQAGGCVGARAPHARAPPPSPLALSLLPPNFRRSLSLARSLQRPRARAREHRRSRGRARSQVVRLDWRARAGRGWRNGWAEREGRASVHHASARLLPLEKKTPHPPSPQGQIASPIPPRRSASAQSGEGWVRPQQARHRLGQCARAVGAAGPKTGVGGKILPPWGRSPLLPSFCFGFFLRAARAAAPPRRAAIHRSELTLTWRVAARLSAPLEIAACVRVWGGERERR
jgi:hypothetical protein